MAIARTSTSTTLAVESEGHAIPSMMRAAVYRGVNDVRMEEVPVPEVGSGEILVRVHTSESAGLILRRSLLAPTLRLVFLVMKLQGWSRK